MKPPTYLLAKYIPDLKRMEPRNIGVILWTPDGSRARFIGERLDRPGVIDGRVLPNWIDSIASFKQWIGYWNSSISSESFSPPTGGPPISTSKPEFIDALLSSNRGNYALAEAGHLLDGLPYEEIDEACLYLFKTLVEQEEDRAPHRLTLDDRWDDVVSRAGLKSNPYYHQHYEVAYGEEKFLFSDALANGTLEHLFERVPFYKGPNFFMKNAHHAMWQFEKVFEAKIVKPENTAAIISLSEEQEHEQSGRLASLRSITQVWNIYEPDSVAKKLTSLDLAFRVKAIKIKDEVDEFLKDFGPLESLSLSAPKIESHIKRLELPDREDPKE